MMSTLRVSIFRLALILGTLTAFAPLAIDMYLPAFPAISREMGGDMGRVQLSLPVFLLGLSVGQLLYGPVSDRLGRRLPLIVGCLMFSIAAVGCAFARSVESLIGWRLVMGLGGSSAMVLTRAVVRDLFDEKESARMYSLMMLVMSAAPLLAPLAGGQLLTHGGWRPIFWVQAGFGLGCAAAVLFALPETLSRERRISGAVATVFRRYGRLLMKPRFIGFALAAACGSGVLFSYISGSSFVFIELQKIPPQYFGFVFGINALGLCGAAQFNRVLLKRYTPEQIMTGASTVNALSGFILIATALLHVGGSWIVYVLLFTCLSALGLMLPNLTAAAMAPFAREAGSASAVLGMLQYGLGSGAGALTGFFHNGTALPMFSMIAICGVTGLVILFWALKQGRIGGARELGEELPEF